MKLEIGKYTVTTLDEYNFGLYETKKKGTFRGVESEGNKEHLIGYYGSLNGAMNKIVNETLLSSDEHFTAQSIKEAFTTVETNLNNAYSKIKPAKKEEIWKLKRKNN